MPSFKQFESHVFNSDRKRFNFQYTSVGYSYFTHGFKVIVFFFHADKGEVKNFTYKRQANVFKFCQVFVKQT